MLGCAERAVLPLSFDKFHGANPQQYVGLVPPERYSGIAFKDFDLGNARHREQMWVGRVELLFTAEFFLQTLHLLVRGLCQRACTIWYTAAVQRWSG